MKKIISVFLLVLFAMGIFCGCAKDNTEDDHNHDHGNEVTTTTTSADVPGDPFADENVKIYMDNRSVWEYTPEGTEWYGYLFLDLDFDGTLELIRATNAGTGFFSTNKFYKIDKANNTVTELEYTVKKGESQWDFTGGDYPQLYKNNATGELKYMVYDNYRNGMSEGGMSIGEMTLENSEVITKKLWAFDYAAESEDLNGEFTFVYRTFDEKENAKEVDADAYEDTLAKYEENNTHMNLTFEIVDSTSSSTPLSELSDTELQEILLRAYNHFSYK